VDGGLAGYSGEDLPDYLSVHIGEASVDAPVTEGQLLMVDAQ
jgi:hypothetical protein